MAQQRYILDENGAPLRRVKISRGVKTPQDIARVDLYRLDDDGTEFRTSLSLDSETFALATAIHGGDWQAREWLRDTAERLWEEDRLARHAHEDTGLDYAAELSVSREVQRRLLEAATAHLFGLRRQTGAAAPQAAQRPAPRRTSAQRATQFAAYQAAWNAAHQAAYNAAYQQARTAGRKAGQQAGKADGWQAGYAEGLAAAAIVTGDLVKAESSADGRISVTVVAGEFAEMSLADLADADLILVVELLRDAEVRGLWTDHGLILAWLDRHFPSWREAARPREEVAAEMETTRAWRILGLPPGSGRSVVAQARTRLLRKIHPDVGGSDELASQVNAAADHLLSLLDEDAP